MRSKTFCKTLRYLGMAILGEKYEGLNVDFEGTLVQRVRYTEKKRERNSLVQLVILFERYEAVREEYFP